MTASIGEMKESARLWAEEEPKGYELRAEILAAAAYGLRNQPKAMMAVRRVRKGTGSADMIADNQAMIELGYKYASNLKEINFDFNLLELASKKVELLNKLYSKLFVEKGTSEFKDARDRAFTYMRKVMGEILDAAEYAFRKNTARLDFYYSSYRSRKNGKNEPVEEEINTATK
jgi:hypothetical protein